MAWDKSDQRNPDDVQPGCYALKLVKGGVEVAARIWHDDFEDGKIWNAIINGEPTTGHVDPQMADGVQQVWLRGRKIDEVEYNYLIARYRHHKQHDPAHPFANPEKPVNRRLMKPIGG